MYSVSYDNGFTFSDLITPDFPDYSKDPFVSVNSEYRINVLLSPNRGTWVIAFTTSEYGDITNYEHAIMTSNNLV